MQNNRRNFLKSLGFISAGLGVVTAYPGILKGAALPGLPVHGKELFFEISLAEWSLHKQLFAGKLDNLDFPAKAKNDFGISAVEYVNQFFKDKAKDKNYLAQLNQRAEDHGVKNVLIMIDGEGQLGSTNGQERKEAVENHYKWVEAAKFLGCHSIRVNAAGKGTADEVRDAAVDGLGSLTEFGDEHDINIIVENHGGYSSNGKWLASVMKEVDHPRCGTLPDFGNFKISETETYDIYKGVEELMPYAKGVSAKALNFNAQGEEPNIDFGKLLDIVKSYNYTGYIGIEYEGSKLSEDEGIMATKHLLEKHGNKA